MSNLHTLSVREAAEKLAKKEVSSVELTEACVQEIEKKNPELNAYVEVFADATEQARAADERRAKGEAHQLLGIPLAIKDNILLEGRVSSAGSKMLEHYVATYDSTVGKKLKNAGAVFLGRTNMDEFAMGNSTESSAWGRSKNPLDPKRVPGGSSGGSAAAVAGHLALGSLGSETCGSIRQPASHTGLVGLNPTYGVVSRSGLIAMASSLDRIGPLTKTVDDAQLLFESIVGHDPLDSTSVPYAAAPQEKKKLVFGVPRAFSEAGVAPDIQALFNQTLQKLQAVGHEVRDIELPHAPLALAVYFVLSRAESSTNLARFDGTRYGLSIPNVPLQELYTGARTQGFGQEVRRRILMGTYVLSAGYADAYYRRARAIRDLVRTDFNRAFGAVDVVVTPMCAQPAFVSGEKTDPLALYAEDLFAAPANLAEIPALSVPMGSVVRDGVNLPVGFNIMAPRFGEQLLFSVGREVEQSK